MNFRIANKTLVTACLLGLTLGLGTPSTSAFAQDNSADSSKEVGVVKGMHAQLDFTRDITRIAVGDTDVLTVETLSSRRLLLLGSETGRTSLLVWFEDDSSEAYIVAVQPDLAVLRRALKEIHANIEAEMAPDREAVVLRGVVPDVNYSRAAEAAAASYLRASKTNSGPLVRSTGAGGSESSSDVVRTADQPANDGSVINLIRVEKLPETLEQRISAAIAALGGAGVTVRRLVRGDTPDDDMDVLVLEGDVGTQTQLTRILHVVSTLFLGDSSSASQLKVTANEAGGLLSGRASNSRSSSSSSSSGSGGGSSGRGRGVNLSNQIQSNIGRATVVSVGGGRILSFIEVQDLPQVRVEMRVYEINRTELLSYAPNFTTLASDFDQGSLSPASGATSIQGSNASRVGTTPGQDDVQNVLSFLADGLTESVQASGRHYAVSATLNLLESRGLARSLSSPTLTVLSGETANFQVGGEVPVPASFSPAFGTGQQSPGTTPGVFSSVEFREFGVQLAVRPLVGDDGQLTIDVFTQVDQPDDSLTTVIRDSTGTDQSTTSFATRSIKTTTRLEDGQSLMIGGLNSSSTGDDTSYTPGLESIPVIGWLFKRFTIQDEDRELLIVVNPTIVRSRIAGLGLWQFPDLTESMREYVDAVLAAPSQDETAPAAKEQE